MQKDKNERTVAESYMCYFAGELIVLVNRSACIEIQASFEILATDLSVLEDVSVLTTDDAPQCQGTIITYCEITLIPDEEVGKREAAYHSNHLIRECSEGVFRADFFVTRGEAVDAYTIIREAFERKDFRDREFLVLSHLHLKLLD